MPITNAGTYLGYTLGRTKPSLYFENGRYTQEYPDKDNIGWHPNGSNHRGENITKDRYDEIMAIEVGDTVKEKAFVVEFKKGSYDSDASTAKYFEVSGSADIHPSSSRLIKTSYNDFDDQYDATYASNVLKNGVNAPNG
ncbi:MAG: hypothetical protein QNK23_18770 [Crocinitomicaceae bacterium]|nr:hypothetical protein [Crocinitomicaceae bacterium]